MITAYLYLFLAIKAGSGGDIGAKAKLLWHIITIELHLKTFVRHRWSHSASTYVMYILQSGIACDSAQRFLNGSPVVGRRNAVEYIDQQAPNATPRFWAAGLPA